MITVDGIKGGLSSRDDGTSTCKVEHDVWTYNNGVILHALDLLSGALNDTSYNDAACAIADTAIRVFTPYYPAYNVTVENRYVSIRREIFSSFLFYGSIGFPTI